MYVAIAIALCLLIAGLLLFFLLPRSVKLESSMPEITPKRTYINKTEEVVSLTIEVSVVISACSSLRLNDFPGRLSIRVTIRSMLIVLTVYNTAHSPVQPQKSSEELRSNIYQTTTPTHQWKSC